MKTTATSQSPQEENKKASTFRHDAKAQIVNLNCLASIVEGAAESLDAKMRDASNDCSIDESLEVIRNDILPCLRMMAAASKKLDVIISNNECVDTLIKERSE